MLLWYCAVFYWGVCPLFWCIICLFCDILFLYGVCILCHVLSWNCANMTLFVLYSLFLCWPIAPLWRYCIMCRWFVVRCLDMLSLSSCLVSKSWRLLFGIYCVCGFFVCLFFKIWGLWTFGDMPFYVRYIGVVGSHICILFRYLSHIVDMFTLLSDIIHVLICKNSIMLFLNGQVL